MADIESVPEVENPIRMPIPNPTMPPEAQIVR
jgi:hypothetical protein